LDYFFTNSSGHPDLSQIGMKSTWVLSEEERYHRFRKQREKAKQHEVNGDARPDRKHDFLVKEDLDHSDQYNLHNSQHSDEDDHHQVLLKQQNVVVNYHFCVVSLF
jgi:hypothetical protein